MTYQEILEAARTLTPENQYKLCDILIERFPPHLKSAIRYDPESKPRSEDIRKSPGDRISSGDLTEQERRDMEHRDQFRPFG